MSSVSSLNNTTVESNSAKPTADNINTSMRALTTPPTEEDVIPRNPTAKSLAPSASSSLNNISSDGTLKPLQPLKPSGNMRPNSRYTNVRNSDDGGNEQK